MLNQNLLLGDDGYLIQRSLRLRGSASAYLTRTVGSNGNAQKCTWSGWVKRGSLSLADDQWVFGSNQFVTSGSPPYLFEIVFKGAGSAIPHALSITLESNAGAGSIIATNAIYRDISAWYHIVVSIDTTQATAANRTLIYINGQQVTSFYSASYVAQNTSLAINQSGNTPSIGCLLLNGAPTRFFDGYISDVNYIDGQALTPSSFGETDVQTGVWKPKRYAGTYGTNGFFLNFSDNSAATAAAIGKDSSGNGNNWTPNNISVTSGATYDSMLDVPTLTSATAGNYCVLNPISNPNIPIVTASNGNLSLSYSASAGNAPKMALTGTIGMTSGKWYWEWTEGSPVNSFNGITTGLVSGGSANGVEYVANTSGAIGSSAATYSGTTFTVSAGDVIGEAFDAGASSVNFGQRPFAYTPPSGFKALNTFNLPTPTIGATASTQANKYFDATTYTGNGSTQSIVNSGGFQPDLVWSKGRSVSYDHGLFDAVRGATAMLSSDSTGAEGSFGDVSQTVTAFNSNGFTVGTNGTFNQNSATYVGWQWKAGGSAVSNTNGSITSQVSANPSAGFSVVKWTSNGNGSATVGHGLGVQPKIVIYKDRTAASDWYFFTTIFGSSSDFLRLNTTDAKGTSSNSITSTTFNNWFGNTNNLVAYCFSEVAGYSKFGSYTGNGSTDGPFVHLGFRPRFIMRKRTDSTGGWLAQDSSRPGYNAAPNYSSVLYPNTSAAEDIYNEVDILSNGFKIRAADSFGNASGGTYIYIAFAENPFKNSLAR